MAAALAAALTAAVLAAAVSALTAKATLAEDMPDQFRDAHCMMCHAVDHKSIGPAYKDIAIKYKGNTTALAALKKKVKDGGGGVWGAAKMPPHPKVSDADLDIMVTWILAH
jgi:cytochrome c